MIRQGANSDSDLCARRTTGDTTTIPLATAEYLERSPEVTPDGRYLAYAPSGTGRALRRGPATVRHPPEHFTKKGQHGAHPEQGERSAPVDP